MKIFNYFKPTVTLFFVVSAFCAVAQKQPINVAHFNLWQNISQTQLGNQAAVYGYVLEPLQGNTKAVYGFTQQPFADTINRAQDLKISPNEQLLFYTLKPDFNEIRKIKLAKQNKEKNASKLKEPNDSLGIVFLHSDSVVKFPNLKQLSVPVDSGNMAAFLVNFKAQKPNVETDNNKKNTKKKKDKKEPEKSPKTIKINQNNLGIIHFDNQEISWKNHVKQFKLNNQGNALAFVQAVTDTTDSLQIVFIAKSNPTEKVIFKKSGIYKSIAVSNSGNEVAFLFSADTSKNKQFQLYLYQLHTDSVIPISALATPLFPPNYTTSEFAKIEFTDNDKRLFFGYGKAPEPDSKDTLLDAEKPVFDLWSWHDSRLQPQQLKSLKGDLQKYVPIYYDINSGNVHAVGDTTYKRIIFTSQKEGNIALGLKNDNYEKQSSWEWPSYNDLYLINLNKNTSKLIEKAVQYTFSLSPSGNYLALYHAQSKNWILKETETQKIVFSTYELQTVWHDTEHDTPMEPNPVGYAGWTNNDDYFIVYDTYDIWLLPTKPNKTAINYTLGCGAENNTKLRFIKTNNEPYINVTETWLLSGFNTNSKAQSFYNLTNGNLNLVYLENANLQFWQKARGCNELLFRKSTATQYPDLYLADLGFLEVQRLTNAAAHQDTFNWVKVNPVTFKAKSGKQLNGLIYLPENFDSANTYPAIIYFYEKYSDRLHQYYTPKPSASTINPTHYASNGYVVFIPDIEYKIGHPGKSAYDAIMGASYFLENTGFIDSTKIGIQGQSWGGYQVAYIVTQTNKFACAMAGAAVTNMTSAYGGIRWGSGYSRMFQYEETQSRIGGSLWENFDLFYENSPLFFAPQVKTPLLMMNNDNDGAVPWYQGIEFFVALRRLNKPVWMLNYNNDFHNLTKLPNKVDLTIRMMQFFDYYLKNADMPNWMQNGIPATVKGKQLRYDLLMEPKE